MIEEFNQETFQGNNDIEYIATFRSNFVYIHRIEYGNHEPISRIKYTGNFNEWEFAIYKWSRESYDPDEYFFPGSEKLDGSIKGALQAGHKAYPPHWSPEKSDIKSFLSLMFGKKNK